MYVYEKDLRKYRWRRTRKTFQRYHLFVLILFCLTLLALFQIFESEELDHALDRRSALHFPGESSSESEIVHKYKRGVTHRPADRLQSRAINPERRAELPDNSQVFQENEAVTSKKPNRVEAEPKINNLTPDEEVDNEEASLKGLKVGNGGNSQQSLGHIHAELEGLNELHSDSSLRKEMLRFPTYAEFKAQDERADSLPDILHTSFEDATRDVELQGWEDEWFTNATYDSLRWGLVEEPKIDFVYTWVNGSDKAFTDTIYPYELNSTLNDPEGKWIDSHKINRYRDWDELRYSVRTVENFANTFRNKIMLVVNSVGEEGVAREATPDSPAAIVGRQFPLWLNSNGSISDTVQILAQEDFFDERETSCLPTFDSLTIENQLYNTKSDTDRFFALSDDMFFGKLHAASDIYSPLFGPTMGFKTNAYNTIKPPDDVDARRFGEKPFLIYTSYLLNRRFGSRKRKGQVHFGRKFIGNDANQYCAKKRPDSMSRSVTREAIKSFPRPALQSTCQRFRGETGFQLYSWYLTFHYTMERHREALLWSYIMLRSDTNGDGTLNWSERQTIMAELEEGMRKESDKGFRHRMYYSVPELLEEAGLQAPKVNIDVLWTSLDGPIMIKDIECSEFNVNECLAAGFSTDASDKGATFPNPVFSSALIFDSISRQHPQCGDCLLKLLLNRVKRGMDPLLPHEELQSSQRQTVIKALSKYHYTIVEPDAMFVMVTDAHQVSHGPLKQIMKRKKEVGQLCLNDDVSDTDEKAVEALRVTMKKLFNTLAPEKSSFELD